MKSLFFSLLIVTPLIAVGGLLVAAEPSPAEPTEVAFGGMIIPEGIAFGGMIIPEGIVLEEPREGDVGC